MKSRISIYLTDAQLRQLEFASREPGQSKSSVVEDALARKFDPERQWESVVTRRLDRMEKRSGQMLRDLAIIAETQAAHLQIFLTHMPPLIGPDQDAQRAIGAKRYETMSAYIARRLSGGTSHIDHIVASLGDDVIDRWSPPANDQLVPPKLSTPTPTPPAHGAPSHATPTPATGRTSNPQSTAEPSHAQRQRVLPGL